MKKLMMAAMITIALTTSAFAEDVFTQPSVATLPTDGHYITDLDTKSFAIEDEWFYPMIYVEMTTEKGFVTYWFDMDSDGERDAHTEVDRLRVFKKETERGIGLMLHEPMSDVGSMIIFHGDGDEDLLFVDTYDGEERVMTMVLRRE